MGLKLIHGSGLGDIYGTGFHGGLFGRHHTILPSRGIRQASDETAFNPRNRLTFYGHPERNQISDTIPAFETLPVSQKYGTPHVLTNGLYEPQLRQLHIAGLNSSSYPTAGLWHYPGLEAYGTGVGLGMNHGADTPDQYSKGSSGHHAGWMSAFHEQHGVHGMAELGKTGFPERATTGHCIEVTGPVMETHKNITSIDGSSSPGYGNRMGGYHTMLNYGYQGLANDHNFGLHKDMHIGGAGKQTASQYHGNRYYGMVGYHRDEFPEAGYHIQGHHGINGYHGGGYHGNGHYGAIVRSHKDNDVEEVSTHDTASAESKLSVYKAGMSVAEYPPVLSNGRHSATHYARGLHIDLLHGGTATLDAENSDHVPDEVGVTGAQAVLGGAQNGIPAKHVPGGTHLTESGNGNQGSSKTQQYLMGLIPNMLVGVGLGLQGHQFNENTDGKLWTGYDSYKYDYYGGDTGYGVVPSTYLPWYNSYSQHYITPYPSVLTDYGNSLR
jgi:hypothetical protein